MSGTGMATSSTATDAPAAADPPEHPDGIVAQLKKYHARIKDKVSPEQKKNLETKIAAAQEAMETAEQAEDSEAAIKAYRESLDAKYQLKRFPSEDGIRALDGKYEVFMAATRAYTDAERAYMEQLAEMLGMKPSPSWISTPALEVTPCRTCDERPREVRNLPCNHSTACTHCTVKWFATHGTSCQQCRESVTSVQLFEQDKNDPAGPPSPLGLTRQQTFVSAPVQPEGTSLQEFFKTVAEEAKTIDEKCQGLIHRLENGESLDEELEEEEDMGFDLFD